MKNILLSKSDREFFTLIRRAAFTNPFSEERNEVDRVIAGTRDSSLIHDTLEKVIHSLSDRLKKLERSNHATINAFSGEDRDLWKTAFLFQTFHRFTDQFGQLIRKQIDAGDTPCTVPFSRKVLCLLTGRGITEPEAIRYFAIFYQLRRGYYFIREGLVGHCPSMRQLRKQLWNKVFTYDVRWYDNFLWNRMEDFSTLLLGETGTGKGTSAVAIGRSGFIPFDGVCDKKVGI